MILAGRASLVLSKVMEMRGGWETGIEGECICIHRTMWVW
jgi:hypothetical protein